MITRFAVQKSGRRSPIGYPAGTELFLAGGAPIQSLAALWGSSPTMAEERIQRRLAAILATDVVGYSRMMGADEEGTYSRLKARQKTLLDPIVTAHRGRIFKTAGDGMLAEFDSVVDALRCAVVI